MVRRSYLVSTLTLAALTMLTGCRRHELQPLNIVEEGPAPTEVLLPKLPPLGRKAELLMQMETTNTINGKKLLVTVQVASEIIAVKGDAATARVAVTGVSVPRNDFGGDETKLRRALGSMKYTYTGDRYGNFVSGEGINTPPTSFHFPNHPVKAGDNWQGERGMGKAKQRIDIKVEKLLRFKGHEVALISYHYINKSGDNVVVRSWADTVAGESIKHEEEYTTSVNGVTRKVRMEMHNRRYE